MGLVAGSVTLLYELAMDPSNAASEWADGPAPFEFTNHETGLTNRADIAARSEHFHERAHGELYGGSSGRERKHRLNPGSTVGGWAVEAAEVLVNPSLDHPLAIVHVRIAADNVTEICGIVQRLARSSRQQRSEEVGALFGQPPGCKNKPLFYVVFAHLTEDVVPLIPGSEVLTKKAQWLRALSTATDPSDPKSIPLDLEDPGLTIGTLYLSGSWRAQLGLNGAAFVGWSTDGADPFLVEQAGTYVKSLHVDAILMGLLQQESLQALADKIYRLDIESDLDDLERLQRELLRFRQNLWWQHITPAGTSNRLLLEFQQQHRLEELFNELVEEINQFGARLAQRSAERTNRVLGLITFVAVPAGGLMTAAQIWFSEGILRAGGTVGAALLLASLTLLNRPIRDTAKRVMRPRASR